MTAAERLASAAVRYANARADWRERRDQLAAEVKQAAANGMPEAQIARHAGVTRTTVRMWIRETK